MAFIIAALALTGTPDFPEAIALGNIVPQVELHAAPIKLEDTAKGVVAIHILEQKTKVRFQIEEKGGAKLHQTPPMLRADAKAKLAKRRSCLKCPSRSFQTKIYEEPKALRELRPEAEKASVIILSPPADVAIKMQEVQLPFLDVLDTTLAIPWANQSVMPPKKHFAHIKKLPKSLRTIPVKTAFYAKMPSIDTKHSLELATPDANTLTTYVHAINVTPSESIPDILELNKANVQNPPPAAFQGFSKGTLTSKIPETIKVNPQLVQTFVEMPAFKDYASPLIEQSELQKEAIYIREPLALASESPIKPLEITKTPVEGYNPNCFALQKTPLQHKNSLEQKSFDLTFPTQFINDFATFTTCTAQLETPDIANVESSIQVIHKIPYGTTDYDFYYDQDAPKEAFYLNSVVYVHPDQEGKKLIAASAPFSLTFPKLVRYPHVLHTAALALEGVLDPLSQREVSFTYTPRILCNETPDIQTVSAVERPENPSLVDLFTHNYPSLPRSQADVLSRANRSTRYNLSRQPTSNALNNVASSDEFDIDVSITKRKDLHKGYVFSISVYPNQEINLRPVQQNYIFVIDKTATVQKYRYDMFRKAILGALNHLQEGDTFNIYIVDKKIHRLSETPLLWRKKHVAAAKQFLSLNNFTHFFNNAADLYDLLPEISNELPTNEGENTIVLLTDGSSLANIQSKKHTLANLFENNKGRYTLHTACIDRRSKGAMLDLVSTFSNGEFIYSQTNTAFPRKLARLVKHTSQLLSKDMHVTLTNAEGTNVEIYPHPTMMPHMYADRPFTIFGTIDEPKDLDLVIQGRYNDRYLYIKKKANLTKARESTRGLNKILAIQQAYVCYEHYLNTHDSFYLEQAEERLREYKLKPATR